MSYQVPAISLRTLLNRAHEYGPVGLVKLDVEGVEFSMFDGSPSCAEVVGSVAQWLVEFHPYPQTPHPLGAIDHIREWFHSRGYGSYTRNGIDFLFWR